MKKILMLLLTLCLVLSACNKTKEELTPDGAPQNDVNSPSETTDDSINNSTSRTLDNLKTYFQDNGIEVGEQGEKEYSIIGAQNGYSLMLDGQPVEFYDFNLESLSMDMRDSLNAINDTGTYSVLGTSYPAYFNGNLLMLNYDKHNDPDKLKDLFNKYK